MWPRGMSQYVTVYENDSGLIFADKIFKTCHRNVKIAKVFSYEINPLYVMSRSPGASVVVDTHTDSTAMRIVSKNRH